MVFEKLYNEIYAILSLKIMWKGYKDGFAKSESPDWLNIKYGIGIEVTQALLQYEGQAQMLIDKYLGAKREDIPVLELEEFGIRAVFFENVLQAILPRETDNTSCVFKSLYRFDKKLAKLNTNYTLCANNCLYMYTHNEQTLLSDVEKIYRAIREQTEHANVKFNMVFLNCESTLYEMNFDNGTINVLHLSPEIINRLEEQTYALRTLDAMPNGTLI